MLPTASVTVHNKRMRTTKTALPDTGRRDPLRAPCVSAAQPACNPIGCRPGEHTKPTMAGSCRGIRITHEDAEHHTSHMLALDSKIPMWGLASVLWEDEKQSAAQACILKAADNVNAAKDDAAAQQRARAVLALRRLSDTDANCVPMWMNETVMAPYSSSRPLLTLLTCTLLGAKAAHRGRKGGVVIRTMEYRAHVQQFCACAEQSFADVVSRRRARINCNKYRHCTQIFWQQH